LSTNHPGATGEVTQVAVDLGAELRDFDALQYHPNGGAWPENMQGYSIPETTRAYGAVLLNADGEEFTDSLGPRDAVSQAIVEEVEKGKGVETPAGRAKPLRRKRAYEHDHDHRARSCSRRRRGSPVRLGAEGHSAGLARGAGRCCNARDIGARATRSADDFEERQRRREREEPRLSGHGHRRLHLQGRRAFSPASGANLRCAEGRYGARDH